MHALVPSSLRAAALPALVLFLAPLAAGQDDPWHHLFTFRGDEALDYLGYATAAVGDVDGDGVADVAVGAPEPYSTEAGYVRVLSGKTGLEIRTYHGDPASGPLTDRFGYAIAGLGDLNGDGFADLAVGAPHDDDTGSQSGSVRLFSGRDGTELVTLRGSGPGNLLGYALARAGDVNGDGHADLIVGAPGGGYVRVFSGEWIRAIAWSQAPASAQVLFDLVGPGRFGRSVAGLGLVNGDGLADFAVGAPDDVEAGRVFVYSGATGAVLHTLTGSSPADFFGRSIGGPGDVNGDGFADLLVGAPAADQAGVDSGAARLVSGEWIAKTAAGQVPLTPRELFTWTGTSPGELFGVCVSGAGDLNGDRRADFAVGAVPASGAAGYVRLLSGSNGAVLYTIPSGAAGDLRGIALAPVGDLNQDGYADLALGSPLDGGNGSASGSVRVFSGKRLTLASDLHAFSLTTGGVQTLRIDAGPANAGEIYVVLGSATGTAPGIPSDAGQIPLNPDWYYLFALQYLSGPPFAQYVGVLDGSGRGQASFTLPGGMDPNLVSLHLDHAVVLLDLSIPTLTLVSNPVPLSFTIDSCAASSGGADCNANGVLDACDIDSGTSLDCNGNGVPDECDLAAGTSLDEDGDGLPDTCTQVVYVDGMATGANDGTSWSSAYRELGVALANVGPYTQVWVARGTYRPDNGSFPPGNQGSSFLVGEHVGIYGGFAGGETQLGERDWVANPTLLSGDLAGNDVGPTSDPSRGENARNVVSVGTSGGRTTVIDGFTITGGYAGLLAPCDFYEVNLKECSGGGIYTEGSPTVRDCVLSGNYGGRRGGGMYSNGDPLLVRCRFQSNDSLEGGGIFFDSGGQPTIVSCDFRDNSATSGGALFVLGPSAGPARIHGSLFSGNRATEDGGALFNVEQAVEIASCTLASNTAGGLGGGVSASLDASQAITNSILWNNLHGSAGTQNAQLVGGLSTLFYCSVQGWNGTLGGPNLGTSPSFVNRLGPDGIAGTADDDLHLSGASALIDAGWKELLPFDPGDLDRDGDEGEPLPLDLDGLARVVNSPVVPDTGPGGAPVVDLGCYERN